MKKKIKITLIVLGSILGLLVVLFLYINNGGFIKRHVLPRVADTLGMPVTAGNVQFSLFGHLRMEDLLVGEPGDPLFKSKTFDVTYSVMPLLSGNVSVNSLLLEDAEIDVTEAKLPKFVTEPKSPDTPEPDAGPGKMPVIRLRNIQLKNVSVAVHTDADEVTGAAPWDVMLSDLNFDLPILGNGEAFSFDLKAALAATSGDKVELIAHTLSATAKGNLSPDFLPQDMDLKVALNELAGKAGDVSLVGRDVAMSLQTALSGTGVDIKEFRITETSKGAPEADLRVTGRVAPDGAALAVTVDVINSAPLDILGAAAGLKFGDTTVHYAGDLSYSPATAKAAAKGDLSLDKLTVSNPEKGITALSPVTVRVHHDASYDPAGIVTLAALLVKVDQSTAGTGNGESLVSITLDNPMVVNLNDPTAGDGVSNLTVKAQRFPLTLIAPLVPASSGVTIVGGTVQSDLAIKVIGSGKQIDVAGGVLVSDLNLLQGENHFTNIVLRNDLQVSLKDMNQLRVDTATVRLWQQAAGGASTTPIVDAEIAGNLDGQAGTGALDVRFSANGKAACDLVRPMVGDLDVGNTSLSYVGKIAMLDTTRIGVNGDLTMSQITLKSDSRKLPAMAPLNLKAHHELNYTAGDAPSVHLKAINADVSDGSRSLVTVKLQQPTDIGLGEKITLQGATSLLINVDRFPMIMGTPFVPADLGLELAGGDVNVAITAAVTGEGNTIQVSGSSALSDVAAVWQGKALPVMSLAKTYDLTISDLNRIVINEATSTVSTRDAAGKMQKVVTMTPAGSFTMTPMEGTLTLEGQVAGANAGPLAQPFLGDIDFGSSAVYFKLVSTVADAGDKMDTKGELSVTDFTVSSVSRGIPKVEPMKITVNLDAGYLVTAQKADLRTFDAKVQEGGALLVDAKLLKPSTIDVAALSKPDAPLPELPLSLAINRFSLSRLAPFLSPEGSIRTLAGVLDGKADLQSAATGAKVSANFTLEGLSITGPEGPQFKEPLNLELNLLADAETDRMLIIRNATMKGATASSPLVDFKVVGNFDAAFKARKSELSITSQSPIDARKLQDLLPQGATTTTPDGTSVPVPSPGPSTGGETTPAPEGLPPMWVIASLVMPKILYGEVMVTDFQTRAILKDNLLTVEPSSFKVNEGTGKFEGTANLTNFAEPTYAGKVTMAGIPVQPLVTTFLPKWELQLEGGLKTFDLNITGKGKEPKVAMANLEGPLNLEIQTLKLIGVKGGMGQVVSQSLQVFYGIGFEDLAFTGGGVKGSLADGVFNMAKLNFIGPAVQLDGKGTYNFVAEKPIYDMVLTPYFSATVYNRAPGYVKDMMTATDNGMYRGETYPIKSSGKSGFDMIGDIAKKQAVDRGKKELEKVLPKEAKGVLDLLNGGGGTTAPADGTQKQTGGGGFGDLLKGVTGGGSKAPAPAPEEPKTTAPADPAPAPAPAPEKTEEKKQEDAVKDVLKGLF